MEIQQLQENLRESDFVELKNVFQGDEMFQTLIKIIAENRKYFNRLEPALAVDEIVWWLKKTNVDCTESGLNSEKDIEEFALTILSDILRVDDIKR